MLPSWVWHVPADDPYDMCKMGSGRHHCVHDTSYGRCVGYLSINLSLLFCGWESLCPIVELSSKAGFMLVSHSPCWSASTPFVCSSTRRARVSLSSDFALSSCPKCVGFVWVPSSKFFREVFALNPQIRLYRILRWACRPHIRSSISGIHRICFTCTYMGQSQIGDIQVARCGSRNFHTTFTMLASSHKGSSSVDIRGDHPLPSPWSLLVETCKCLRSGLHVEMLLWHSFVQAQGVRLWRFLIGVEWSLHWLMKPFGTSQALYMGCSEPNKYLYLNTHFPCSGSLSVGSATKSHESFSVF